MTKDREKEKAQRKISRVINLVTWSALGFLVLGYFPTMYLRSPIVSIVAAAMAVIPYGMWIGRPVKAAIVAGLLGMATGASAAQVLSTGTLLSQHAFLAFWLKYMLATGGFCAAIGGLFGYMAQQRRRQVDEEWHENDE